jgi:hypothetical protein
MQADLILKLVNVALPAVLAVWRQIRESNPAAPTFTDAQVIEMAGMKADEIVATADAWLAAHPPAEPDPQG